MRAWVARLLSDALRRAAEQDRGAGAPGDAPGAPDAGATESERPEARARRAAAEAVMRALRCALAAALRVPLKVASPARVPYAAMATVLKARRPPGAVECGAVESSRIGLCEDSIVREL